VIEEVLQSSDIIFTCWRRSVCDWSRSITILWYNLQLVEGILTTFNKLKIISEDCNNSTSITDWPPSTSWILYQRIVILLLQSHTDRLQQVKIIITILWYNLQLVEGIQYGIEVEVLQSSDIIFTCWRWSVCDWSRSITILWYN
jgi:hypothetical protein